jgi:hypothetical protein
MQTGLAWKVTPSLVTEIAPGAVRLPEMRTV